MLLKESLTPYILLLEETLLLLYVSKFIEASYIVSFILEFNLTSNLMGQNSKEGVVKSIARVVIADFASILKADRLPSKYIQGNAIQMRFGTETCIATVLINIVRPIN